MATRADEALHEVHDYRDRTRRNGLAGSRRQVDDCCHGAISRPPTPREAEPHRVAPNCGAIDAAAVPTAVVLDLLLHARSRVLDCHRCAVLV